MYVIREVLNCKPGKVRQMVEKFRSISTVLKEVGQEPLRVLTDVTGEPYWTIVAEARVEKIDDFFAMEQNLMTNEMLRRPWLTITTSSTAVGGKSIDLRADVLE
jgi:hypothetical protein